MSRRLLYAALVVSALALGAIHIGLKPEDVRDVRVLIRDPRPMQPRVSNMARVYEQADAQVAEGSVVLLGDSLTERFPNPKRLSPQVVNYGIGGMTTRELRRVLPRFGAVRRASVVVLTIGTNDVRLRELDGLEGRMREISERIPVRVVWNAIPPTHFGPEEAVGVVNATARKVCAERPDCTFLETRWASGDFTDGTHLSRAAYTKWTANLRSVLHVPLQVDAHRRHANR